MTEERISNSDDMKTLPPPPKHALALSLVAFCILITSGPCPGLTEITDVSKERAKELGLTVRTHPNGTAGIRVRLEVKTTGELQKFSHVGLLVADGEHELVSTRLLPNRPSPDTVVVDFSADPGDKTGEKKLRVCREVLLDGTAIAQAFARAHPENGSPEIAITFTPAAAKRFATITRDNIERRLAIVFDGKVLSAPTIMEETKSGQAMISGLFTEAEANAIAEVLTAQRANAPKPGTPAMADLSGSWQLNLPAGFQHTVVITAEGPQRFRLSKPGLNMNGIYEVRRDRLAMVVPDDPRLTGFVWQLDDAEQLTLIEEPPAKKTGARYITATLNRIK